jgi:hypothetical protein
MPVQTTKLKDYMIPIGEYITVSQDVSLYEAVASLTQAKEGGIGKLYEHYTLLVNDRNGEVVGKLGQWKVLKALEPGYSRVKEFEPLTRFGLSPEFLTMIMDQYDLFHKPLDFLCSKAARIQVKDLMDPVSTKDCIDVELTLNEGIHQLIMSNELSLLVKGGGKIVGILRLCDVFREVCHRITACAL